MFLELPAPFSEILHSHYAITVHLYQMAAYFDGRICFFYSIETESHYELLLVVAAVLLPHSLNSI